MDGFHFIVKTWLHLFITKLHSPLTQQICAQGKSESKDLFGSSVIDFLECLLDCKRDITLNIDSGGWCYIKGQYKLKGTNFYVLYLPSNHLGLKPLTVEEQRQLHDWLYHVACTNNNYYLWRLMRCEEFDIDFNDGLSELDRVLRDGRGSYWTLDCEHYDKNRLIIEVDLKCRKELAPVELLLELLKEEPCEDDEDESANGTHTVQDPGTDLELKLQITLGGSLWMSPGYVYKYLIQQRHTDT
jgi:hypothetical protein